jgi:hypothetical protein
MKTIDTVKGTRKLVSTARLLAAHNRILCALDAGPVATQRELVRLAGGNRADNWTQLRAMVHCGTVRKSTDGWVTCIPGEIHPPTPVAPTTISPERLSRARERVYAALGDGAAYTSLTALRVAAGGDRADNWHAIRGALAAGSIVKTDGMWRLGGL